MQIQTLEQAEGFIVGFLRGQSPDVAIGEPVLQRLTGLTQHTTRQLCQRLEREGKIKRPDWGKSGWVIAA